MPSARPSPAVTFVLLLLLSLAVGFAALGVRGFRSFERLDSDEQEYVGLARDLLRGEYEPQSFRLLGHPLVLAGALAVTGDSLPLAQVLVLLLASTTAPLVWLLVRRLHPATGPPRGAAVVAALLVAVWPPIVFYNATLYSEPTALPLFMAFLCLLPLGEAFAGAARVPAWRWAASGLLLGLCVHVRPMYAMYLPFAALLPCVEARGWRPAVGRASLLVAGCMLVLLPWIVHVSRLEGRLVKLSTNGGCTLAGGLNPVLIQNGFEPFVGPDGRQTWVGPGKWLPAHRSGYLHGPELELRLGQQDALLTERCLAWVKANPGDALYLTAMKLAQMWGMLITPQSRRDVLLGNVPTLALLALGVVAMWRLRRRWREVARLWTLPLFVSAVTLISWGSWRFRQAGDIGLIALCAIGLWPLLLRLPKVEAALGSFGAAFAAWRRGAPEGGRGSRSRAQGHGEGAAAGGERGAEPPRPEHRRGQEQAASAPAPSRDSGSSS